MDRGCERGTVVRKDQQGTLVLPDGAPPSLQAALRCHVRRGLREELARDGRGTVVVGDRVQFVRVGDGRAGVIEALEPRRSVLLRRRARDGHRPLITAANVDTIAVVVAARDPEWKPGFVDRVLCAAELSEIAPLVVLNKIDLLEPAERRALEELLERDYRAIGIPALLTSTVTGEGIDALRERVRGRITLVSGPSGAGKSSLLNALGLEAAEQRTAAVSARTRKGRHTTTSAVLLPLREGGFVVDTPGVRAFGFYDLQPGDLDVLFREIRAVAYDSSGSGGEARRRCRFADCLHREEPGCAVREAVAEGRISPRRFASYLRILESLEQEAPPGP